MHFQLLRYLVAVGSAATRDRAELAERFKLPTTIANNSSFLTSVKASLATEESQRELLEKEGMQESVLADLTRMTSEMGVAIEAIRVGRRDLIGAQAELETIAADLMGRVKVQDGITGYRFWNDREMITERKAVRQIPGQPRPVTSPPPAGDEVVPSEPGGVALAE